MIERERESYFIVDFPRSLTSLAIKSHACIDVTKSSLRLLFFSLTCLTNSAKCSAIVNSSQ